MGTKFYKAQKITFFRSGIAVIGRFFVVFFLVLAGYLSGFSQTNLSFTQLSGDFPAPGKGAQNWGLHTWNDITQPTIPAGNSVAKNYYTRFNWLDIESNTTQGSYNWTVFDNFVNQAIDAGAMFTFGVMPLCDGCGPGGAIPQYVVNLMNAEGKPGPNLGVVYPNYQSTNWSKRYSALLRAIANHIASTSRNGHTYTSAFAGFDLRHAGNFGEFADLYDNSKYGAGAQVTDTYLNAMVDTAIAIYPNVQLTIPMGYFTQNNNLYGNTSGAPGEASAYKVLTASNNFGRIGWRRDNIGDDGYNVYFTGNTGSYNPGSGVVQFQPLIMNMWKFAPIGGEPSSSLGGVSRCGTVYCDFHNENLLFHYSFFGNGNAPGNINNTTGASWTQVQTNWRAAAAEQGYRLILTGGSMTTTLSSGGPFNVTVNWQNIGLAPVYEKWNVTYELRNSGGAVVWTGNSTFTPRLFLPQGTATPASDNFTLSSVPSGTYSLYMVIRDPLNYKAPLPLGITGRNSDGSYLIRNNITVGTGGPVNQPPTANAGSNITIQLPISTVSLTGTGSDADGSVASYAWTKTSGPAAGTITSPAAANTSVTGLVQGTYIFTLTVKDNQGATTTDDVQVTVSAAAPVNQPPVAVAGSDATIQLPTSSVSLTGTGSDPDGSVASYAWTKTSGPASGTIASPAAANTSITGLVQGVYVFTLTVKDNLGATTTDNVQVTVNAAAPVNQPPVAKAGTDMSITMPTNAVGVNGSSSSDPDGTISTYQWSKVGGPTSFNIVNGNAMSTTVNNLTAGVYSFQLKVTDNAGAASTDTLKVTVNVAIPPPNQPPVAKAGSDQSITLPTNSATINGGSSSDPDGSISSYSWTKLSGPTQFAIGNNSSASTIVNNLTAGVYSFQLKVTDNIGATALDTVRITVNSAPPANQLPVANAGSDVSIILPTNITNLNGSASADTDGTISNYSWNQISGPNTATIGSAGNASTGVSGLSQGTYVFALKVTDNSGGTDLDSVKVTVNAAVPPPNQAPVANAGTDMNITLPTSSVNINGSSSTDPDGTISTYQWTKISGPTSFTFVNGTAVSTAVINLTAGVYTFQLKVTDNSGGTDLDSVKVTVNAAVPPPNQAPVANAGNDMNITLPTNSINVSGSASTDPDGTISTYQWTKISGPAQFTIANGTAVNTAVNNLTTGVYSFQLKVTDNTGASDSDILNVTVNAAPPPPNQPPVAKAGADQNITLPTNSVTINGNSSSDPDGSISSYQWAKLSGPAQFTIGNNTAANTSVNNLTSGVYTFQLKVTDNIGAIALDTIKIIVNTAPVNQPPVANAGSDINITLPTNLTNLNGSASSDADGTISTYAWSQISGPNTATIGSAGSASTGVSGLLQGSYVFALKVTDNSGGTDLDSVKINVNAAPNLPPIAFAGNSKSITLPVNNTSLDGSLSSDPDGTISSYNWSQVSGPSGAILTGANNSVANAGGMVAGVYNFQLTVTDNMGATSSATVKITVAAAGIQPPVANAGADQTITLPTNSVTLNGAGSSAPSGSIVSYTWTEKSGPSSVSLNNTAQNTVTNLQAGVYIFKLTVTDNNAATGSDSVKVTVNPAPNQAPVADAGTGVNLTLPNNSTSLNGTASFDPDGTISSYNWTRLSGPNAPTVSGSSTATLNLSGLVAGTYNYRLTVTDNKGASSSAQVKIIVTVAPNVPPVANAGPNQSITAPANSVILNGSASMDPDGTIASYSWVTISGPGSITINNSNTVTPSAVGLVTGGYVFELTITDNNGASSKDQISVTVLPATVLPNQPPVANAGNSNFTITAPENSVTLNASNSFDPDGTITSYSWKNTSGPSVASMSDANAVSPTVSQLLVGTYVFELTVTDNNGATNIDYVNVIVNPSVSKVNQEPVANAGNDNITITLPVNSATLDGSNSYDPDGSIVSYSWKNTSGPSAVDITGANTALPAVSNLLEGTYSFELTVTDNSGASTIDYVNIIVKPGQTSFTSGSRLTVFPNPAHSVVNQRITSPIMGTVKVSVYDMNGKLVITKQFEKTSDVIFNKMVVDQLAPGLYSMQVNIANRTTLVTKFIKN